MSGKVKLKLYKGNIRPAGIESPHSLYLEKMASFKNDLSFFDQKDAVGFIRLFGLNAKTHYMINGRKKIKSK